MHGMNDLAYWTVKVRFDKPGNVYHNIFAEAADFIKGDAEVHAVNGPYLWDDDHLALDLVVNVYV